MEQSDSSTAGEVSASSPQLVDGLFHRLDHIRRIARNRQRRFQIPLGVAGVVLCALGIVVGLAGKLTVLGPHCSAFGPCLLLLCVQPTNTRMIGLAISCVIGCVTYACFLHGISKGGALGRPRPLASCPPPVSEVTCALFAAANWYAIAILCLHGLFACYLWLALLGGQLRVDWLPWRQPRRSLDSLWRLLGTLGLTYSPVWITLTLIESREPSAALHLSSALEAERSSRDRLATRAIVSVQLVVLGSLALWPRLRTTVQSRLASIGEGVAAAAGISELIGYTPTQGLVDYAQETLRSVRLDQLEMRHLEPSRSSYEPFALSTPATLGSIDVFLSHSWHDPLPEKWAVLQAWRERFVRDNGREPVVWLDRACLDPACPSAQLPALPVYCAACDKLLALRGPTYLNRLWCCVELYVFFEMMSGASSRIEIVPFACAPAYTSEGMRVHETAESSPRDPSGIRSQQSSAPPFQRFDVQRASCAFPEDDERMLAVIECGSGFDSFNAWMHRLLSEHSHTTDADADTLTARTSSFSSRRERSTFRRGEAVWPFESPAAKEN